MRAAHDVSLYLFIMDDFFLEDPFVHRVRLPILGTNRAFLPINCNFDVMDGWNIGDLLAYHFKSKHFIKHE